MKLVDSNSMDLVIGLDFFIGLPKEENFRVAYTYPPSLWEVILAADYWNAAVALLTDPDALISKAVANPPELDKVGAMLVILSPLSRK